MRSPRKSPNADEGPLEVTSSPAQVGQQVYRYYYNGKAALESMFWSSTLSNDEEAWVMGHRYCGPHTTTWAREAVSTISYFTYRRAFTQPLSNGATHDAGWGCMARTGQMMLNYVLRRVFSCAAPIPDRPSKCAATPLVSPRSSPLRQPRDGSSPASSASPLVQRGDAFTRINLWFADVPEAPYGIHQMSDEAARHGLPVGQWFTPSILCKTLVALIDRHETVRDRMFVDAALDQAVYEKRVLHQLVNEGKSYLLLVPVMFGMTALAKPYDDVVRAFLRMPVCVGIVGGKPNKSLFFVGYQGDTIFYLDPHVVQEAFVSPSTIGELSGPRGGTPISSLDPCMVLCFFFNTAEVFNEWVVAVENGVNKTAQFPVIVVNFDEPLAGQRSHARHIRTASVAARPVEASPRDSIADDCDYIDEEDL